MKWFLGVLFTTLALVAMGAGTLMAWSQHRAISHSVAVRARIATSDVEVRHGSKSTTYKPVVNFSFTYGGQTWNGNRVTFLNNSSDRRWAYEIVRRFPAGAQVEAWVDPAHPEKAFLLRLHEFFPYGLVLGPMAFFLFAILTLAGIVGEPKTRMLAVPLGAGSLLLPAASLRRKLRGAMIAAAAWMVVGAAAGGHYLAATEQTTLTAWIFLGVYGGLTLVPLGLAWKYRSLASHLSEPRVTVQPAPAVLGERLTAEVEFDAYAPLRVREVRVALACIEHYREKRGNKTQFGTRVLEHMDRVAGRAQEAMPGGIVAGSTEFTVPPGEPASSPAGKKVYPWYHWQVEVVVTLDGAADYKGVFPLEVAGARAAIAGSTP